MHKIVVPLQSGDSGSDTSNLIEALLFLVERGALKSSNASGRRTAKKLQKLTEEARADGAANK